MEARQADQHQRTKPQPGTAAAHWTRESSAKAESGRHSRRGTYTNPRSTCNALFEGFQSEKPTNSDFAGTQATASIDLETALRIHEILRQEMEESTLNTITHRLEAVRDADYIILCLGR